MGTALTRRTENRSEPTSLGGRGRRGGLREMARVAGGQSTLGAVSIFSLARSGNAPKPRVKDVSARTAGSCNVLPSAAAAGRRRIVQLSGNFRRLRWSE